MTDRETIMAPFGRLRRWQWYHKPTEVMYHFTRQDGDPLDGPDIGMQEFVGALEGRLSEDWVGFGKSLEALKRPPPEPYEYDPRRHHERLAAMREKLEAANVGGAHWVSHTEPGWLLPMEMAVDGIVSRIALHDGPAKIVIQQIKEKLGTLRFYIHCRTPALSRDLYEIADWAQLCSVGRCLVTGQPGTVVGPGWLATLSPKMAELRERDMDRLRMLMSPEKP